MMSPSQISKLPQGTYPMPQHAGLRLEVRASKKSWTIRRRNKSGLLKQQVLGHFPEMSLAGAIAACVTARHEAQGTKPKAVVTMREVVHAYCIGHIRIARADWMACENAIWRNVGDLADKVAGDVRRSDAHALIQGLTGKPAVQRKMRMELAASWEWGIDAGLLPEALPNPFARVRVPPPKQGTRILSDDEIVTLFKWLEGSKLGQTRDAIVLTLATCCRSGELLKMRKSDVDLERREWHLRTSKNGLARTVYLNDVSAGILEARLAAMEGEKVFPAKGQHVFVNALYRVRGSIGIDAFGMHSLRRTGRTCLSRLGCPPDIGERLVGHAIGGVKGIYDLYSYGQEQKEWMQRWGRHLQALGI